MMLMVIVMNMVIIINMVMKMVINMVITNMIDTSVDSAKFIKVQLTVNKTLKNTTNKLSMVTLNNN